MNKNKFSKLLLCTLLISTIFSIPVVNAEPGKWPAYLFKKPGYFPNSEIPGYHIGAWWWPPIYLTGQWEVPAGEYCFYRTGWIVSDYEIEMGYDPGAPATAVSNGEYASCGAYDAETGAPVGSIGPCVPCW